MWRGLQTLQTFNSDGKPGSPQGMQIAWYDEEKGERPSEGERETEGMNAMKRGMHS